MNKQKKYEVRQHRLICEALGVSTDRWVPDTTAYEAVMELKQTLKELRQEADMFREMLQKEKAEPEYSASDDLYNQELEAFRADLEDHVESTEVAYERELIAHRQAKEKMLHYTHEVQRSERALKLAARSAALAKKRLQKEIENEQK